jgi:hypothetical protein
MSLIALPSPAIFALKAGKFQEKGYKPPSFLHEAKMKIQIGSRQCIVVGVGGCPISGRA